MYKACLRCEKNTFGRCKPSAFRHSTKGSLTYSYSLRSRMKSRRLDRFDFVFCPRYRRKIFLIDGVEARFKELVHQICEQNDIDILALECHIDHCHLFVNCPPKLSPADVMRIIKSNTGLILRKEFSAFAKVPNMWTRSYFVSTAGSVSNDTIQRYIETQKTRG